MSFSVRVALRQDIPGMHRVRLAVRENRLTSSAIREEHYVPAIEQTGRGWVAVEDGNVLGFAVGNKEDGNIWALFVDPIHERRGIGRKLQEAMIAWLFETGLERLWLSTDPDTRAQKFYEASGWQFVRMLSDGEAMYELRAPHLQRWPAQAAPVVAAVGSKVEEKMLPCAASKPRIVVRHRRLQ